MENNTANNTSKFSLSSLIRSYRRWLPLIVVVTCLGTLAGALWIYRMDTKRNICATLLITDTSKDSDLMNVAGMSSLFGSNVMLDNQVEKMKSHDLLKGLVKKFDLNVSNIYNKNLIKREQKFLADGPMVFVAPESICDTLTTKLIFKVRVNKNGLVSVKGTNGKKDVIVDIQDLKFPVDLKTIYGDFSIEKTAEFDNYVATDGLPLKMTFIVSNYDYAAEDLSKKIMPTIPNKKADIIELSYICPSRKFGMMLLSDFISDFNRIGIAVDVDKARMVNEYLEKRIGEVHEMVTDKEAKAEAFARENNIINPLADGEVDYTISAELKKNIILARADIEKLNMIKSLLGNTGDKHSLLPVPAEDEQIALLVTEYNQMVQEKMRLEIDATPSNKLLKTMVQQLDAYRENLVVSIDNAITNAEKVLNEVNRQKVGLDSSVKNYTTFARGYTDLMRDYEINNAIYMLLLKEQEHNYMKMNNTLPTGIVLSAPHVMKKQPGLPPYIMLFLIFCISLAIVPGAIYVWSLVDDRINGVSDIHKFIPGADMLGSLPALPKKEVRGTLPYAVSTEYAEKLDGARAALQFTLRDIKSPVILVTGARNGVGRTAVATGLAASWAATGKRTLLLELDVKSPSLAATLSLSTSGLSNLIATGITGYTKTVQTVDAGYDVLTAGDVNVAPLSLLASPELSTLIDTLRQSYDIIIIDGPSIVETRELSILSSYADASLAVVRDRHTTYAELRDLESMLSPLRIVVNATARPGILTLWK